MRRAAFGDLIGVSKQQVSKYVAAGAIVLDDAGMVDVEASLAALAGRLDESKRQRALQAIEQGTDLEAPAPATPMAAAALPIRTTAKQEKDAVERDLKLLEYGRQAAELVSVRDVETMCERAIADMREVFANGRRDLAADICANFGLPPEKAIALQRALTAGFERCMGRFAERMTGAEDGNAVRPEDPAAALG